MKLALIVLPALLAALILIAVNLGFTKEGNDRSALQSRLFLAFTGMLIGGAGWLFLAATISDPQRYFFSGFVLGPMFMLAGLYAVIISIFFPAETARGAIRHYFNLEL